MGPLSVMVIPDLRCARAGFRGVVLFPVCLLQRHVTAKRNVRVSVNVMVHPE